MFNQIAPTYDTANRILSLGADIRWRRIACVKTLELSGKSELDVVDVATGTGDMLIFWQKIADKMSKKLLSKTGVDPAENMMAIAKQKVNGANFLIGMAQDIPLDGDSADVLSISYGFRNVVDKEPAVREFARVLRNGGHFCLLEFMRDESSNPLNKAAQWYVRKILPFLGGVISGNLGAYRYLPESIENFLSAGEMKEMLTRNGFEVVFAKDFSFGVSSLIIARKL
jgi:demethylmenaquinone methyltransferase / 2-methoxy-6-polyprenyl-1,4-benzoquinol methylase